VQSYLAKAEKNPDAKIFMVRIFS